MSGYQVSGRYIAGHPNVDQAQFVTFGLDHETLGLFKSGFGEVKGTLLAGIPLASIKNLHIEDRSTIEKRVTATRMLAVGVFAFAFKKEESHPDYYLTIEWQGKTFLNETIIEFSGQMANSNANALRNQIIRVIENPDAPITVAPAQPAPKKSDYRFLIGAVLGVVFLLVVVFIGGRSAAPGPGEGDHSGGLEKIKYAIDTHPYADLSWPITIDLKTTNKQVADSACISSLRADRLTDKSFATTDIRTPGDSIWEGHFQHGMITYDVRFRLTRIDNSLHAVVSTTTKDSSSASVEAEGFAKDARSFVASKSLQPSSHKKK
jgi:hypothetical protein